MVGQFFGFFFKSRTEDKLEDALEIAVKCGYRQIDTAYVYGNEERIGKTLQKLFNQGIVKRSEMFITTKVNFELLFEKS